jgi:hypothetical protein
MQLCATTGVGRQGVCLRSRRTTSTGVRGARTRSLGGCGRTLLVECLAKVRGSQGGRSKEDACEFISVESDASDSWRLDTAVDLLQRCVHDASSV